MKYLMAMALALAAGPAAAQQAFAPITIDQETYKQIGQAFDELPVSSRAHQSLNGILTELEQRAAQQHHVQAPPAAPVPTPAPAPEPPKQP